jgi:hypothetical protein
VTDAETIVVERIKVLTGLTEEEIRYFFPTLVPFVAAMPDQGVVLLLDAAAIRRQRARRLSSCGAESSRRSRELFRQPKGPGRRGLPGRPRLLAGVVPRPTRPYVVSPDYVGRSLGIGCGSSPTGTPEPVDVPGPGATACRGRLQRRCDRR